MITKRVLIIRGDRYNYQIFKQNSNTNMITITKYNPNNIFDFDTYIASIDLVFSLLENNTSTL